MKQCSPVINAEPLAHDWLRDCSEVTLLTSESSMGQISVFNRSQSKFWEPNAKVKSTLQTAQLTSETKLLTTKGGTAEVMSIVTAPSSA